MGLSGRSQQSQEAYEATNLERSTRAILGFLQEVYPEPLCAFELDLLVARYADVEMTGRSSTVSSRCTEMFDAWCLDMPGVDRLTKCSRASASYALRSDCLLVEDVLERYGQARRDWATARRHDSGWIKNPRVRPEDVWSDYERHLAIASRLFSAATPAEILQRVASCAAKVGPIEPFIVPRVSTVLELSQFEAHVVAALRKGTFPRGLSLQCALENLRSVFQHAMETKGPDAGEAMTQLGKCLVAWAALERSS